MVSQDLIEELKTFIFYEVLKDFPLNEALKLYFKFHLEVTSKITDHFGNVNHFEFSAYFLKFNLEYCDEDFKKLSKNIIEFDAKDLKIYHALKV